MADLVEKASATEIKITRSVIQVQPLRQLVQRRAGLQSQLDSLTAQLVKMDALIKEAGDLGVVTAVIDPIAPVDPVIPVKPGA